MPGNALVTGGCGFIGAHLVNRLLLSGFKVVVIDDLRTGDIARLSISNNLKIHQSSITNLGEANLSKILKETTHLFHLAAEKHNSSLLTPEKLVTTNIVETEILLRLASRCGVPNIVFTSSLYAYGGMGPYAMNETDELNPTTLYGFSKSTGENLLKFYSRKNSINAKSLRLFFTYGPNQFAVGGYKSVIIKSFELISAGKRPQVNGSGNQALDYIFIDDVVDAIIKSSNQNPGYEFYNVCNNKAISILDIMNLITEITGVKGFDQQPPDWTENSRRFGSNAKIIDSIGWNPKIDIVEGLTKTWNKYDRQ